MELMDSAQTWLLQNPNQLIGQFTYQNTQVWLKRRPYSKKTFWHSLQQQVASLLQLPLFYATVSHGGPDSLHFEAQRLKLFLDYDIPVPQVLAVTDAFLITRHTGEQLHAFLGKPENKYMVEKYLFKAVDALKALHKAGLYHGRPSLKDMTLQDDTIFLIDLEEDALEKMSLEEAQAKDIWLFLNSAANHASETLLAEIFASFLATSKPQVLLICKKMVLKLKPCRVLVSFLAGEKWGRDVRNALKTNKVLEDVFLVQGGRVFG